MFAPHVNNNPVKYTDETGHDVGCHGVDASSCGATTVTTIGPPFYDPSAYHNGSVQTRTTVDVNQINLDDSIDNKQWEFRDINRNPLAVSKTEGGAGFLGAVNSILQPFANAANARASSPDVTIDVYHSDYAGKSGGIQIPGLWIQNNSPYNLDIKSLRAATGGTTTNIPINGQVPEGASLPVPVPGNNRFSGGQVNVSILMTFPNPDDYWNGVRMPNVTINWGR